MFPKDKIITFAYAQFRIYSVLSPADLADSGNVKMREEILAYLFSQSHNFGLTCLKEC